MEAVLAEKRNPSIRLHSTFHKPITGKHSFSHFPQIPCPVNRIKRRMRTFWAKKTCESCFQTSALRDCRMRLQTAPKSSGKDRRPKRNRRFRMPVLRELFMWVGARLCEKKSKHGRRQQRESASMRRRKASREFPALVRSGVKRSNCQGKKKNQR